MEILVETFDYVSNESGSLAEVFLNIDFVPFVNTDN